MSDHESAHKLSQDLCDALFEDLRTLMTDLDRSQSKKWCGFFGSGRKRFAYINHRKTITKIDLWRRGDLADLQSTPHLIIRPRQQTTGGFQHFTARFFLEDRALVKEAARLLSDVSVPKT